jgi:hypothetical protein
MPLGWKKGLSFMTKWIGAAILMFGLIFGGPATINDAAAAPLQTAVQKPDTSEKTGFSARRRVRHHYRYAYRGYDRPLYYDRPYYYAPAPFVPFNFGYGLWPWW